MNNISFVQDQCVGCRSCEQVCPKQCIAIKPTTEGFLYPVVDENQCVQCRRCVQACPTQNTQMHRHEPQSVWAFRNRNEDEIMRSASGGAADVAANVALQKDGVVYGAAYDENFAVRHIEVTGQEQRERLQSSKYVQSDIHDCYSKARSMLREGRIVLFTGTPCQIAGLYAFLGGDQPNLYTVDLICHGVPSPKLFAKYLQYQNRQMKSRVLYYNFRSKDKRGWGTRYLLKTNSKSKTNTLSLDRYGKHFMVGDCYRESCYQCSYANTNRVADITVGDFWGILRCHPEFFSEKGVSSVLVNTDKGAELFKLMQEQGEILQATLDEGLIKQGNLVRPTRRTSARDVFYQGIDRVDYIDNMKVGLQMKERLKAVMPPWLVILIKKSDAGVR